MGYIIWRNVKLAPLRIEDNFRFCALIIMQLYDVRQIVRQRSNDHHVNEFVSSLLVQVVRNSSLTVGVTSTQNEFKMKNNNFTNKLGLNGGSATDTFTLEFSVVISIIEELSITTHSL